MRLDHVVLWTKDPKASMDFYTNVVGLTPVLPKEVETWFNGAAAANDILRFRRLVPLNEDWRTGVVAFRLIERNEHFRALAA